MNTHNRQGLFKKQGLYPGELVEAENLVAICNHHEGLDLPANLELAAPDSSDRTNQFLFYEEGTLTGILTLQRNGEIEVCLAVHPRYRRKGVGRGLLAAAMDQCAHEGVAGLLLVCEERSQSGMAFVRVLDASYRSSEYRMRLDRENIPSLLPTGGPIQLRRAGAGDVELLARLIAASFGNAEASERQRVERDLKKASHRFYIGHLDGNPVGCLGIVSHGDRVYIIAFAVLTQYRGRGYGRQMLAETVAGLVAENWKEIMIEVATDNPKALSLYRSCGFQEVTSYGFYRMPLL